MQDTISVPINRHASGIPLLPTTTIQIIDSNVSPEKEEGRQSIGSFISQIQRHPADQQPMYPIH